MIPEFKAKWLEALRGGKYEQAQERLRKSDGSMCCLGVLCDLYDPKGWGTDGSSDYAYGYDDDIEEGELPGKIAHRLKITSAEQKTLIEMNDKQGKTFAEIADYVEANL